jgi:hypothetical protein
MDDEFSFDKFNLPKQTETVLNELPEELKQNVETPNPALEKEKDPKKKINFIDIDKEIESILGNNNPLPQQYQNTPNYNSQFPPQHVSQQNPFSQRSMTESLALPFDTGTPNSYLSLVLSPNLRELELMIRGLEYVKMRDPATGREEVILRKIEGHPLNEYGINQILTHIKIYASPEIKLGRKKERDYYLSIQQVGKTITRLIYKNLKNFGMDTQEKQRNAKAFCLAIIELIDSAYSRSLEGRENDLSRATEMRIEGSLDSFSDPSRLFKQQKDQMKN